MNTYKIVETIEEGDKCLTVVPSCWEKDGILFWPSNKNIDSLRKKCIVPLPNWSKEKCILKREGIASLGEALKMEKHMSQFSDTDSELEYRKKPHKRFHSVLKNSQGFNYDTSLGFAAPTKKLKTPLDNAEVILENVEPHHSPTTSNHSSQNIEIHDLHTSSNETANYAILSNTQIPITELLGSNSSLFIDPGGSNTQETQQIYTEVYNLGLQQNNMLAALARIETQQAKLIELIGGSQKQNVVAKDDDLVWISNNIPINSIETLQSFEEKLNCDAFKNKLVKVLSRICGRDGKQNGWAVSYKIMDSFIRRETVNLFSWTGIPKKRDSQPKPAYSRYLNIMDTFYEVIKLADFNYTLETNTKFFKSIVKNSQRRFFEENEKLTHSSNTLKRKKVDENKQTNKENEVNDLSSTVDPYEDKAGPSTAKTNESQSN